MVVHPLDHADGLLREYRALLATAPDELTCWAVMRKAPPLPFLPPEWHGREVLIFAMCHAGEAAEAERDMAGLRALGRPIADVVGPHAFTAWQAAFDPLLTPGARNYWKSHDFAGFPTQRSPSWSMPRGGCQGRNARSLSFTSAVPQAACGRKSPSSRNGARISA